MKTIWKSGGTRILYNRFDRNDGVSVVAVTGKDEVVLLKEYRHGVKDFIWSIPCGKIEAGEKVLEAAARELLEESGYQSTRFEQIGDFLPVPAASDNTGYTVLARDLIKKDMKLEVFESIQVEIMPYSQALELVWTNEIKDAWVMIPLLQAARFLGKL